MTTKDRAMRIASICIASAFISGCTSDPMPSYFDIPEYSRGAQKDATADTATSVFLSIFFSPLVFRPIGRKTPLFTLLVI